MQGQRTGGWFVPTIHRGSRCFVPGFVSTATPLLTTQTSIVAAMESNDQFLNLMQYCCSAMVKETARSGQVVEGQCKHSKY